jgi:hypothetical protein
MRVEDARTIVGCEGVTATVVGVISGIELAGVV